MSGQFKLETEFVPQGDQGEAIETLVKGFQAGEDAQVLLGVTGSGKTFTMSHVIQRLGRPTLVLSHNKTLAAQLYGELKAFFPSNAVEFFISYYDYYQPEAYVPGSDTFIEKDASINSEIDRLRLKATSSLLERRDVIIVGSVSSIYGLGRPQDYKARMAVAEVGQPFDREDFLRKLVDIHYVRAGSQLERGTFRVRGDVIEVQPAYEETAIRIDTFGDEVESIREIHPLSGDTLAEKDASLIYPAKHFVTTQPGIERAVLTIEAELEEQVKALEEAHKPLEALRLRQRTHFDLEMLQEIGYCSGIENYSRHLDAREAGTRPYCLLDYFPEDMLVVIDESHATIPQVRAMFNGDRNRKQTLVDHGFRLPSALDNRPLRFEEFVELCPQTLFLSATPGDYELERCGGQVVEQVLRPTGLLDPEITVRPSKGQIEDLVEEARACIARDERVLVTTLTKRMAEDLSTYLARLGIRVRYLHSDIESLKRVELLRALRLGEFDVLVGINLLREGLDLPEVGLVAVLDADKEGFLRSARSLFQIVGRAARNVHGRVLFYGDRISDAMARVLEVTETRRAMQAEYNTRHGIVPRTVRKSSHEVLASTTVLDEARRLEAWNRSAERAAQVAEGMAPWEKAVEDTDVLRSLMESAAAALDFERAAELRDRLLELEGTEGEKAFRPQNESREQSKSRNRRQAGEAVRKLKRMKPPGGR